MAGKMVKIKSELQSNAAMRKIDALMMKGEKNLTSKQAGELRTLALSVQSFEAEIYKIPAPKTLEGIIELKMFELKIKQNQLAKLLGIGEPKLSQILSNKRKPDVAFLKAAHTKLGIDGNVLLKYA